MKLLFLVLFPCLCFAQTEVEDAKKSVLTLIKPLLASGSKVRPKGTEKFRVDGCDKKEINWTSVLLMKQSVTLDYKFKKNCDIEGTIKPKVFQNFPANLKIRNIKSFSNIKTQNKITANLESKPILNLDMREGLLTGKNSTVKFEADYKVQINPMAEDPLEKNLGGELRISEINGKKTNIKEKILIE